MVRLTLTCQDIVREHAEPAATAAAAAAAAAATAIASRPSRGVRLLAWAPARARRRKHRCYSAREQWARRRCLHG